MQAEPDGPRVLMRRDGSVAIVSLNRPSAHNAIDDAMLDSLASQLDSLSRTDDVRAVVLTGSGKSFCAGGDLAAMRQRLQAPSGEIGSAGIGQADDCGRQRRRGGPWL